MTAMRTRGRRGSAAAELVMALPFLGLLLGLIFFFGWVAANKQRVEVADRYAAWQRVETNAWPSNDNINLLVCDNRASTITLDHWPYGAHVADDLVTDTDNQQAQAGEFANRLIDENNGVFTPGRTADAKITFSTTNTLWQGIMNASPAIEHHHSREGITWRRDEVNCWTTLRDLYYPDFDSSLNKMPTPADHMAQMIRGLYLANW